MKSSLKSALTSRRGGTLPDEPSRFRVIEGGPAQDGKAQPKPYRARVRGEAELLTCWQCEIDIGIATALTFEMKQGRMVRDGKPEGGTKVIYCGHCLARGKLTKLL